MSDSYYIINPDRKAELHFDYGEYKALPEELKKELKRYFVWGRKRKAWVSKGDHRNFSVITMVSKLDLPLKEKPAKKPAVKLPFKQHLAAYAAWKEVRETVESSAKEWHSTTGGRIRLSDSFELYDFDSQRVRSEDDHSFTFRVDTYLDPDKNVVIVGEHLQQIYGMRVYMRSIRKRVKPSGKQESYGFKVLASQWTPFALPDRVQVPAGKRKPHYRLGEPKSYRDREKLRRDVLLEELMLGKLEMALESKFNGMEDMTERIPEEQQHWYVPGLSQIPEVFYRETPEHYGKNLVLWGHSGVRYALRYHHRPVPQYLDLEGKGKPEKKILGPEAKKKLAEQLRQKAESLEKKAAAKRSGGTFHQNWTPRRAGIMKSLEADAEALEQKAFAFRKLAEGWEAGSVPELLQGIRTIADLNELYSFYPTIRGNTPESYLDEARKRLERLQTMGLDSESRFQAAKKALQELAPVELSEEAQSARRLRELEEKFRTSKQPGFFPTPKAVAEKMIALARVPEGAVILEPSAGLGHLAAEIKQAFPENKLVIGELNRSFHEVLSLKGFEVAFDDFLSYRPAEKDRPEIILMNPPFEKGQDAEHILHAFEMVKPGGQVISLASEGLFFRQSKKETAFREFLEEQGGTSEVLPEKSFTGSGAFKQTGVRTRIVVLEKPAVKEEKPVVTKPEKQMIEPKKKPEMKKKASVQQEIHFKEDVYHFSEDQKIIRKFATMQGKAKGRKELKNAILDLQKKAKEKRFSDPYKPLLRKLQDEAVDLYNGMERDKITRQTVEFSKSLALELEQEAQKKKLRYSVTLLKRFLNLQGEEIPEKAERLLALIQSALKKGKVPKDDPYYAKLKAVEKQLSQDKSPELESRSLEGVPQGVMSAGDLQKMDFKVLPFSGKWAEFIGQPSENFYLIIYGKPKMGKSNLAFQLAKYLGSFGKVLYVAAEEGFGLTLKTKMEENGIAAEDPVHFSDARHLEGVKKHLDQGYAACFIDSINVLDLEPEEFERFRKSYPNTTFVCIMQSTKSGNFRGSQEWTHNADSIVNLDEPGLATCRGRFGAGEYKIFER
ncbi:N-6 DNA methylase [Rapidithrix thailandica]|uniref:N-6 DNA methylase n=1 Tax=Rapidithrix thailandica TaxID=413964 RepID=A0AAW9S444_9BACT